MMDHSTLAAIQDIKKQIENLKIDIDSINVYVNQSRSQIEMLSKRTDLPQETHNLKISYEALTKRIDEMQFTFSNAIAQERSLSMSSKEHLDYIQKTIETYPQRFSLLTDSMVELRNYVNARLDSLINDMANKFKTLSELLDTKIGSLKSEFGATPRSILESNNEILKRLESTTLEASNAMSKTNNIDLNNRMLEKKIENFSIQLKRLELNIQAFIQSR